METPVNTNDDNVTITEALQRLASQSQAPARQSFCSAVNRGRIRDTSNKENNPDGKRTVSWKSVCEYVASGGFRPRVSSSSSTGRKIEPVSPATGQVTSVAHTDRCIQEIKGTIQPPQESSQPPTSDIGAHPSLGLTPPNPPILLTQSNRNGKKRSSMQRESPLPKGHGKPAGDEKSNVRNSPPLRVVKNNLRRLDFEQTKAIRDWADNRLLTVLRPTLPLAISEADRKTPQNL